jgi:hypothetical protein
MAQYDNPAGRLHQLLSHLVAGPNTSVVDAWAKVLDVPPGEVRLRLGEVARLVEHVDVAAQASGRGALVAAVARHRGTWMNAILPEGQALGSSVASVKPDAESLEALDLVSEVLHEAAPEGSIPDAEARQDLVAQVARVREDIVEAEDLPDGVKHLLITRLSHMQQALEQVAVGGPDSVRLASEALAGAIVLQEPGTFRSSTMKRVAAVVGAVWIAFSAGPTIQNSLEAWSDLFRGELAAGPQQEREPTDEEGGSRGSSDADAGVLPRN